MHGAHYRIFAGEYMNLAEFRDSLIVHVSRILFIAVCGCILGGGISGLLLSRVAAQGRTDVVDEQLTRQETQLGAQGVALGVQEREQQILEREIESLKVDGRRKDEAISDLRDQVSIMHGIGIAVGSVLGVLMFMQMFFSRKTSGGFQK